VSPCLFKQTRLAKETSDTQAFLDTLINTASPEGPNGQPALFTLELNSNPATNEQNVRPSLLNFSVSCPRVCPLRSPLAE
jgi:cytochrome oxidase Cu insertion factor (SCO1/SenC/PrrC family)